MRTERQLAGGARVREPLAAVTPSGTQYEITHREQRAVVVEVGGGLRGYWVGDRDVLDGYGIDEMCPSGRGQVLIPWPNRLQDGRFTFARTHHQLALTEPERLNAIHGLVRWATCTAAELAPDRVVMEHLLRPQPGHEFSLAIRVEYAGHRPRRRPTASTSAVGCPTTWPQPSSLSCARPAPAGAATARTWERHRALRRR